MEHYKLSEHSLLEGYRNHRKSFAHWSVLYGVGAPIFFITQEVTTSHFKSNPLDKTYLIMLLMAAAFQVFSSLICKNIIWYMYWGETQEEFKKTRIYKISNYLYMRMWFEWLFDGPTVILLLFATFKIITGVINT